MTRVRDQMLDTLHDLHEVKLGSEHPTDSHENTRQEKGLSRDSGPTESTTTTTLSPGISIELESLESIPDITGSSSSLASSMASSPYQRTVDVNDSSGAQTEEEWHDIGRTTELEQQNP